MVRPKEYLGGSGKKKKKISPSGLAAPQFSTGWANFPNQTNLRSKHELTKKQVLTNVFLLAVALGGTLALAGSASQQQNSPGHITSIEPSNHSSQPVLNSQVGFHLSNKVASEMVKTGTDGSASIIAPLIKSAIRLVSGSEQSVGGHDQQRHQKSSAQPGTIVSVDSSLPSQAEQQSEFRCPPQSWPYSTSYGDGSYLGFGFPKITYDNIRGQLIENIYQKLVAENNYQNLDNEQAKATFSKALGTFLDNQPTVGSGEQESVSFNFFRNGKSEYVNLDLYGVKIAIKDADLCAAVDASGPKVGLEIIQGTPVSTLPPVDQSAVPQSTESFSGVTGSFGVITSTPAPEVGATTLTDNQSVGQVNTNTTEITPSPTPTETVGGVAPTPVNNEMLIGGGIAAAVVLGLGYLLTRPIDFRSRDAKEIDKALEQDQKAIKRKNKEMERFVSRQSIARSWIEDLLNKGFTMNDIDGKSPEAIRDMEKERRAMKPITDAIIHEVANEIAEEIFPDD